MYQSLCMKMLMDLYVRKWFCNWVAIVFKITRKSMFTSDKRKEKKSGWGFQTSRKKPAPASDPCRSRFRVIVSLIRCFILPLIILESYSDGSNITHLWHDFSIAKQLIRRENWLVGLTSHGYQVQVAVPNFVLQEQHQLAFDRAWAFYCHFHLTLRQTLPPAKSR